MGIDLYWEDEDGNILEEVGDRAGLLADLVNSGKFTGSLRSLDEYGDTTFNQLQIPKIITEFEVLLNETKDPELFNHLTLLLNVAKKSKGKTHTYLKFYGD